MDDKEDEEKEVEEKDDEDSDEDSEMWKDMVYTLVNKNTEWQNKYEELQNSFIYFLWLYYKENGCCHRKNENKEKENRF